MAEDPSFVRLHNRLARGMYLDLNSGFGISGLDIVPWPEDPDQQAHVRDGIRRGVYESASQAEVESFAGREGDYMAKTGVTMTPISVQANFQEGQVQRLAAQDRRHFEGVRGLGSNNTAAYEADQKRREALVEAEAANRGPATPPKAADDLVGAVAGTSGDAGSDPAAGTDAPKPGKTKS